MTLGIYFLVNIYESGREFPSRTAQTISSPDTNLSYFALNEAKDIDFVIKDNDQGLEIIFGNGGHLVETYEVVSKKYINVYLKPSVAIAEE